MIDYVSNSAPCNSQTETNSVPIKMYATGANNGDATRRTPTLCDHPTSGDRWEKFETEFGAPKNDLSVIKGSLETCKYQLDRTLFGMQEFVQNVQHAVSFDCALRNLGGTPSSCSRPGSSSVPIPLWDTMERARFRSDIDLNMGSGHAFLGVQLVLPIGN